MAAAARPPEARAAAAAAITAAGKLTSWEEDRLAGWLSPPLSSTSGHSAGRGWPARLRVSISRRPHSEDGYTRSRGGWPGSTRISAPSRCSTPAPGAGPSCPRFPPPVAAPERRQSRAGSSRSAARSLAARSPTCGPTSPRPALVAPTRPAHAAARPRRRGPRRPDLGGRRRPRPGLTVSGAVESIAVP